MLNADRYIVPDWPAPQTVKSVMTTRQGGFSMPPWDSLNLGIHVGDDLAHVKSNRQAVARDWQLTSSPLWLDQVHGSNVESVLSLPSCPTDELPRADACVTRVPTVPCVVMTADCLPILLCDQAGTVVAACHAGWRSLSAGVVKNTVRAMNTPAETLMAWLGPAIGPQCFEVGEDVRQAFLSADFAGNQDAVSACFIAISDKKGKYLADIYGLARLALTGLGVSAVWGGQHCTVTEPERWYSYRRDGVCGRMAALIWLDNSPDHSAAL